MSVERKDSPLVMKDMLAEKQLDGPGEVWIEFLAGRKREDVEQALSQEPGHYKLQRLAALICPVAEEYLEAMALQAKRLTVQRFGKTVRLYAPLYLSNYCTSSCRYCGFNKNNKLDRRRLTVDEAVAEANIIAGEGFRDILLVSGEDREFITVDYLKQLARQLREKFSSISIEIYQMTEQQYRELFDCGIEGVTLYQETYDRKTYDCFHAGGAKADYDLRLSAADHIARAGMREVGLGALLGLTDWRIETLALGQHVDYLMKRYWQCHVSASFPRLRPAQSVDSHQFDHLLTDRNLVQMILALRLCFADVGLVLSTRESAHLRDNLVQIGITRMSAGSKTSPGGYSGHDEALRQFDVSDDRPPAEIADMLRQRGLEPVWKDWDAAFIT